MKIIKADINKLAAIKDLYQKIINKTAGMEKFARWKWNLHPTDAMVERYIKDDAMYLLMDDEKIAGAMAVTMSQGEDYHNIAWRTLAADDEVSVIHILGVSPEYQGMGVGKQLIDAAVRLAVSSGKKALRLDALASNVPAQCMYLNKGFVYCGKMNLYAENTGRTDFFFYEYAL